MLNRRHKVVLFLTLVLTGSALLAGATLTEGLGIVILGVALAWVIGSDSLVSFGHWTRNVPGKMWPWLKLLLAIMLAAILMVGIAVESNYNAFIVIAAIAVYGVFISPLRHLPIENKIVKVLLWSIAVVVAFLVSVGASMLFGKADEAGRTGELFFYASSALVAGMLWLRKGWDLVIGGIRSSETVVDLAILEPNKRTGWLYFGLITGLFVFILLTGTLTFSAFSDAVLPLRQNTNSSENLVPRIALIAVVFGWPYACWAAILKRESNAIESNLKRHKRVTLGSGMVFSLVICLAVTFGLQNGYDRILTTEVEKEQKDFGDVAAKIGAIKARDSKTTQDYIDSYEQIEPLMSDFDTRLTKVTDMISRMEQRDAQRGPLNIQRFYRHHSEQIDWNRSMMTLLRQDSDLTKRQILVTKQMAVLTPESQVDFWNKNFLPLAEEEDDIRQKIAKLIPSNPVSKSR